MVAKKPTKKVLKKTVKKTEVKSTAKASANASQYVKQVLCWTNLQIIIMIIVSAFEIITGIFGNIERVIFGILVIACIGLIMYVKSKFIANPKNTLGLIIVGVFTLPLGLMILIPTLFSKKK